MGYPTPLRPSGWTRPSGRARPYPRGIGGVVMNQRLGPHAPASYELRIEGHLDQHWSAWFGGLTPWNARTTAYPPCGAWWPTRRNCTVWLAEVRDLGMTLIFVQATPRVDGVDRGLTRTRSGRSGRLAGGC